MTAQELEIYEEAAPAVALNLFGVTSPIQVIAAATELATPLAEVVRKQKLYVNISGKDYVRVEGWTLLGNMLGVFPYCVWTRKLEDGWEARVEARTRDGASVGSAEAQCLRGEKMWSGRDDYALRSMAQTRATSKALRQPLGFVMTLAGFQATPAEEMPPPEAKPRQTKTQKLLNRIGEMAAEADAKRDVAAGTTAAEIAAKLGENVPDEQKLTDVGLEVSDWLMEGCAAPFTEYEPVKF